MLQLSSLAASTLEERDGLEYRGVIVKPATVCRNTSSIHSVPLTWRGEAGLREDGCENMRGSVV